MPTKLHRLITAEGQVIEGLLTAGNVSDITVAERLIADVFCWHVVLDRGDDADSFRDVLRSHNKTPVIPGRKNRQIKIADDKPIDKLRTRIEQFFGKIKENKRLAMRYEKSDTVFLAFIAAAIIKTII